MEKRVPELLAPAGDMERLKSAVLFGADAVYLGGVDYGMRASQQNFTLDELKEACDYCHAREVRVYLTVNTLPHNRDLVGMPDFLCAARNAGVDAMIVTDLGVLSLIHRYIPEMEVHVSTQAGVVNYETARAFYEMGARRVVLARELSLEEIRELREKTPPELEIEAFVHGAMCMSFSGRCLISDYLTGRDANRGECAQPCRWKYTLMEEKRPGQYFPVLEGDGGSYLLNAKDLCMIEYLDKLADAGVNSFKIEGRAKSSYYVSVVTNAYRIAIDAYRSDPAHYTVPEWLIEEVTKVSHRRYSTGFYFDTPTQYYENGGYLREWDIVAVVDGFSEGDLLLTQKNRFFAGDTVEILEPGKPPVVCTVEDLRDGEGTPIASASHPLMALRMHAPRAFLPGAIVRKQKSEEDRA